MQGRNRWLFEILRAAAIAAAVGSLACSSTPPPPRVVSESDVVRQGTAACTSLASQRGLTVLEVRHWTRNGEDKWDTRLLVRPQSGGLEYEMGCRYNFQANKASLYRP